MQKQKNQATYQIINSKMKQIENKFTSRRNKKRNIMNFIFAATLICYSLSIIVATSIPKTPKKEIQIQYFPKPRIQDACYRSSPHLDSLVFSTKYKTVGPI